MTGQEKIHAQNLSEDPKERIKALKQLEIKFSLLSDKHHAWNDLLRLTYDKDYRVRSSAAEALGSVFSDVPDKQLAWNDLHRLTFDKDRFVRSSAAKALGSVFSYAPDKQMAWNDLVRLTNDEDSDVRSSAAEALGSVFSDVPDKQQVWTDLVRLTNDEDRFVRSSAAEALGSVFSGVPDKQMAWNDLVRLTNDQSRFVRSSAAKALGSVFSGVPDKQMAWNDLVRFSSDKDNDVRWKAAIVLCSIFSEVPDKQLVWTDLVRLTSDEDGRVRYWITSALCSVFSDVLCKQLAWSDLVRLTLDEDIYVRSSAAFALKIVFSDVPDKQLAWSDLVRLIFDKDHSASSSATSVLSSFFSDVPDKQLAWSDLVRLIFDKDRSARSSATSVLSSVFSDVPDKQMAWNDLHRLTSDKDRFVRSSAAKALGAVFSDVPDKQLAWSDLHRLTSNEDSNVRSRVASAIGFVFSDVPDKQLVWSDLVRLTSDEDSSVRVYANHSLGKISIFKASQAENDEDYKKELRKAIEFFEIAALTSKYFNPSQFCLPFYRSFYTIVFKKQEAKAEVDKYLADAKEAVKDSKSKKQLFEAVENLSEALNEVQNLENLDLEAKKGELNFYRQYCDRAAELMRDTEEKTPFAVRAMRKGLPILDRNLKELLEEIQTKAKIICKEAKGTNKEEIACAVSKEVLKWEIGSQEEMVQKLEDICHILKVKVADLRENDFVLNKIESMRHERNLIRQFDTLLFVIGQIPTMKVVSVQELDPKLQKLDLIYNNTIIIKGELSCTKYDISKIKLFLANLVIPNLDFTKKELNKNNEMLSQSTLAIDKLSSHTNELGGLIKDGLNELDEMKNLINDLPKSDDIQKFYNKLNELEQSKFDSLVQRYSAIISLLDFGKNILQLFLQHYYLN